MDERMELPKHTFSSFFERAGNDSRLLPTHIGLVAALFHHHDYDDSHGYFQASRSRLMRFSRIRSIATYHKCLSELVAYGYVKYRPSWHPTKGSMFRLIIHKEEGGTDGED